MSYAYPTARAAIAEHPLYSSFVSFPTICFVLALLNDIAYWKTANLQWQNFAEWLLFGGLVVGGFVLLAQIIGLFMRNRGDVVGPNWVQPVGTFIVLVLAFINSLVHARDGWTAIVPQGLILSVVSVLVMIIAGWLGRASVSRRHAGVSTHV
jgi:uncharacterized membrane protein